MRVILFTTVLLSATAWARIGGGEGFNSGRSSAPSFSSSPGYGGNADYAGLAVNVGYVAVRNPTAAMIIFIIIIAVVLLNRLTNGDASTRKALDAAEAAIRTEVTPEQSAAWERQLQAADPSFDLQAFIASEARLFRAAQDAWFLRDFTKIRSSVSDATFRRLVVQAQLLQLQGVRDALAELTIRSAKVVGVSQSAAYLSVNVVFCASLRDTEVSSETSDDDARATAMRATAEEFTEVWTFVRRVGVATVARGALQGTCPNCGAPFAGGATNTCGFCKAIVNSGNYDWVLAEITQASEFVGAAPPTGNDAMRATDPAFSVEVLEDRAALLFWSWVAAMVQGNALPLAKVATEEFSKSVSDEGRAAAAASTRRFIQDCAVGSVTCILVECTDGRDLAHVEVRWSARNARLGVSAPPHSIPNSPERSVLILQRKSGAKTSSTTGMATARCPNCNAPLTDNGQSSCEYCHTSLSHGEGDWVLAEFLTWETWRARQFSRSREPQLSRSVTTTAPIPQERARLLYLMAALANADGNIDARERRLLQTTADRWNVDWATIETAMSGSERMFERLLDLSNGEADVFMRSLVDMAYVDGRVDGRERALLTNAAARLGVIAKLPAYLQRQA